MTEMLAKRKYTKDVTGKSRDNLIQDEIRHVSPTYNVIIPKHAPFFEESISVMYNGNILKKGKDYHLTDLNAEATEETGKAVYITIVLDREDLSGDVYLTYQTFGDGDYASTIVEYINKYMKDKVDATWDNIHNKPTYFLPSYHTHPTSDLYGTLPFVLAMNEVVVAIENLRSKRNVAIYTKIAEIKRDLDARLDRLSAVVEFTEALEKEFDKYTKEVDAKIDLLKGVVDNYATVEQVTEKTETVKAVLIGKINELKNAVISEIESTNTSTRNEFNRRLSDIDIQLNLRVTTDELNDLIANYERTSDVDRKLRRYAKKSSVVELHTALNDKVDTSTYELGISNAALTADWNNVANRPFIQSKGGLIPPDHTYGSFVDFLNREPDQVVGTWLFQEGVFPEATPDHSVIGNNNWLLDVIYINDDHYHLGLSLVNGGLYWTGVFSRNGSDATEFSTDAKIKAKWVASRLNTPILPQDFSWLSITGKPAYATRWPRFNEIVNRPDYYPTNWDEVENKPETATRFARWSEVSDKPSTFPSDWRTLENIPDYGKRWPTFAEIKNKPETATRWPTYSEIEGAPQVSLALRELNVGRLMDVVNDWVNRVMTGEIEISNGYTQHYCITDTRNDSLYNDIFFKVEVVGDPNVKCFVKTESIAENKSRQRGWDYLPTCDTLERLVKTNNGWERTTIYYYENKMKVGQQFNY